MLYWFFKVVLTPFIFAAWRLTVRGGRHVPVRGAAIVASNHVSFLDSFFVPVSVLRRMTFVAKAEYFDRWRTRWFFQGIGQIPMSRDGGSASEGALLAARSVIAGGKILGIYPEGTRSVDGRLHRGKTGVARLAISTGAPIVPCGVVGSREVMPKGKRLPRLGKVSVSFGEPIDPAPYAAMADRQLATRLLTDEVMRRIRDLSGQEYVDEYAGRQGGSAAA
ncbi:MAG: 1-acyl-sn-glycerol-3-phosphate acyltransferase [Acidimicrobiia bacterium]|nr:1-acyl-sn-glycerol-3-phosphate acyltransferase [Acidimicrobiia bacterium]